MLAYGQIVRAFKRDDFDIIACVFIRIDNSTILHTYLLFSFLVFIYIFLFWKKTKELKHTHTHRVEKFFVLNKCN